MAKTHPDSFNPPNKVEQPNPTRPSCKTEYCKQGVMVRQYDHEVIAQTAVNHIRGTKRDGPADAALIAPIHGSTRGVVISNGMVPRYSDIDAGAMVEAGLRSCQKCCLCRN